MSTPPPSVAVLGCGLMGEGIARVFADAGITVAVYDLDAERAERVAAGLGPRAHAADSVAAAVRDAGLVIESVPEVDEIKRRTLGAAAEANPTATIASNTSSLDAESLAAAVADPSRFLVAHFFNPAHLVPLVEVVPTAETDPARVEATVRLLAEAGKEPVVLRRAVPGFVANRLQAALLREAFALEAEGVADFDAIDRVVRAGLGSRWAAAGPFLVADLGGLDVWDAVCTQLFPTLDVAVTSPEAVRARVRAGELGAKTGQGIHPHDPAADAAVRERIAAHFALEFGSGRRD